MLDLAVKMTGKELTAGEARLWRETFRTETPAMLEWAFKEYLKTAEFFPMPGQIAKLMKDKRAAEIAKGQEYKPIEWKAVEREQNSPEFQGAAARAREVLARIAKLAPTKAMR